MLLRKLKKVISDKTGIADRMVQLDHIDRRVAEIQWGLTFNSAITDSEWLLKKSFNPGRWAAGYPMLYILFRIYDVLKPKSILELGLGESSKLAYQYMKRFNADLRIVEHDPEWVSFFSSQIFDVKGYTELLPIVKSNIKGSEVFVYSNLDEKIADRKYDLLIVDGPWGSPHYSRHQIVDIVKAGRMNEEFVIVLDDYNRTGEYETAEDLRHQLRSMGIKFHEGIYRGEKSTVVFCSDRYKFITSL